MFGYVTINKEDLTLREYERYHSFYCGLCHTLHKKYGRTGQLTLSYDTTFLCVLLSALYEEPLKVREGRCIVHPLTKHTERYGAVTEYTADMCILLTYYKFLDDWKDDKSRQSRLGADALKKHVDEIAKKYPRQERAVRDNVALLSEMEAKGETNLDLVAGVTGRMLAEIFVYRTDEWQDELRYLGFYLGKYVYLMDAYEDLEKDLKKGQYNVWAKERERKDFEALVENTLTMMMSEAARAYERLPIVTDTEILRNILYSGVWLKYRLHRNKLLSEEGKGGAK